MITLDNVAASVEEAVLLPPTSLTMERGTSHAVRGPNGSGKSTLLTIVAGVLKPTSGTVSVDGQVPNLKDPSFRARLSALLSPAITARDLTLMDHLRLIATSWDSPNPAERAADELVRWEIGSLALRFPHELSSGQRQLFSLATVFVRDAPLLILDEPEQRLDADRRQILVNAINERTDAGSTVLLATHADDVADGVDEVTWLAAHE